MSLKKMVVLFMGAPGSGKGTLAALCEREFGWCQLSTGNLLRQHIKEQTNIGKQIDFIIKSGKLVSDELVNTMVEEWLIKVGRSGCNGIILDGYPRTIGQAESLLAFLVEKMPDFTLKVVQLRVSEHVAVDRMLTRLVCSNKDCQTIYSAKQDSPMNSSQTMRCEKCSMALDRRKDDRETSSIQERLTTYARYEDALLNFYKQHGVSIIECNAEQSASDVFNECKKLMDIH